MSDTWPTQADLEAATAQAFPPAGRCPRCGDEVDDEGKCLDFCDGWPVTRLWNQSPDVKHQALPWARWPWHRCKGVYKDRVGAYRCDLRRRHSQPHAAERGCEGIWRWQDA